MHDAPRADLVKAAQRFHFGDLGGPIPDACCAIDMVVTDFYVDYHLVEPVKSFREGCDLSLGAVVNQEALQQEFGWDVDAVVALKNGLCARHETQSESVSLLRLKWSELFVAPCPLAEEQNQSARLSTPKSSLETSGASQNPNPDVNHTTSSKSNWFSSNIILLKK